MVAKWRARECGGNFAAVDPFHDEEWPFEFGAVAFERHRARNRHGAPRALIGAEFGFAFGLDQAGPGVTAQDQPVQRAVGGRVEPVRLAARAAGDARKRIDRDRRVPDPRQICGDLLRRERCDGHAGQTPNANAKTQPSRLVKTISHPSPIGRSHATLSPASGPAWGGMSTPCWIVPESNRLPRSDGLRPRAFAMRTPPVMV